MFRSKAIVLFSTMLVCLVSEKVNAQCPSVEVLPLPQPFTAVCPDPAFDIDGFEECLSNSCEGADIEDNFGLCESLDDVQCTGRDPLTGKQFVGVCEYAGRSRSCNGVVTDRSPDEPIVEVTVQPAKMCDYVCKRSPLVAVKPLPTATPKNWFVESPQSTPFPAKGQS